MRKMLLFTLAIFTIIGCSAKSDPKSCACKDEQTLRQKADLRAVAAWEEAKKQGNEDQELSCIVKLTDPAPANAQKKLGDAGFSMGVLSGNIATGKIKAKDLPKLARMKDVKYIELAVPLSTKGR